MPPGPPPPPPGPERIAAIGALLDNADRMKRDLTDDEVRAIQAIRDGEHYWPDSVLSATARASPY